MCGSLGIVGPGQSHNRMWGAGRGGDTGKMRRIRNLRALRALMENGRREGSVKVASV